MKTIKQIAVILLLVSVSIHCSRERIEPKNTLNEYDPINDYFNTKKQQEQEFVIDTNGQGPIIGQQGTKIWPIKTNLMYPNGDSVYFPFTLKLIELYTPKDMIYYQMPNVSSGTLLTTAGEIRIRAFKNGQELLLRPGKTWPIEMPAQEKLLNMQIYYGYDQSGIVNWINNPTGSFDTTAYGYFGLIQRLGWIANGKPALSGPTNVNVGFSSTTDNLQNVATFIYFPSIKSLLQVYNQNTQIVPSGQQAKIILMGVRQNQLYHYYWQGNINANTNMQISLTSITDANLTAILDTL